MVTIDNPYDSCPDSPAPTDASQAANGGNQQQPTEGDTTLDEALARLDRPEDAMTLLKQKLATQSGTVNKKSARHSFHQRFIKLASEVGSSFVKDILTIEQQTKKLAASNKTPKAYDIKGKLQQREAFKGTAKAEEIRKKHDDLVESFKTQMRDVFCENNTAELEHARKAFVEEMLGGIMRISTDMADFYLKRWNNENETTPLSETSEQLGEQTVRACVEGGQLSAIDDFLTANHFGVTLKEALPPLQLGMQPTGQDGQINNSEEAARITRMTAKLLSEYAPAATAEYCQSMKDQIRYDAIQGKKTMDNVLDLARKRSTISAEEATKKAFELLEEGTDVSRSSVHFAKGTKAAPKSTPKVPGGQQDTVFQLTEAQQKDIDREEAKKERKRAKHKAKRLKQKRKREESASADSNSSKKLKQQPSKANNDNDNSNSNPDKNSKKKKKSKSKKRKRKEASST